MVKPHKTKAFIRRAKKGRGFLTPKFSKTARRFMIIVGGVYLRFVEGVGKVSFIHENRIVDAMRKFHSEEHRLIFAFRHAAEEDPPVLMYAFNSALRRKIERNGNLSHVRFLYGRDVPNWAGPLASWLFPRIGAIPVQNRGGNREALNMLRREMKEGQFPVALAPEEQIVYHMYQTSGIASGISSLVRWGLESGKPVTVIPLALGYTYGKDPEAFIRQMLRRWEQSTGFILEAPQPGSLHPLLVEAADKTLSMIEVF
jgi:1-acyl-sn-glycerol-3-phosphate acyltransferase